MQAPAFNVLAMGFIALSILHSLTSVTIAKRRDMVVQVVGSWSVQREAKETHQVKAQAHRPRKEEREVGGKPSGKGAGQWKKLSWNKW